MSAADAATLRQGAAGREISTHNRDAGWNLQRPERKRLLFRGSLDAAERCKSTVNKHHRPSNETRRW